MGRISRPASLSLIGPMGAGKSEVGRTLARLLGRRFRDTDKMIERKSGRSVSGIFAEDGEAAFRALESQALRDALSVPGAVIACGGGAIIDPSNVKALRAGGMVVYLKPSLETAASRVRSGEGRPLLERADPLPTLARLYREREPLYRNAADHIVDADGSISDVARAVLAAIGRLPEDGSRENRLSTGRS